MNRPFYALIILLEMITGSLLLIKSAQSQTTWEERPQLPSSIVINAWPLDEPTDGDHDGACAGIDECADANHCVANRPLFTFDGPATTCTYDLDGCFGGEHSKFVDTRPWWARGKTAIEYEPNVVGDVEAEGRVDAPASDAEPVLDAIDAQDACNAIESATTRMAVVAQSFWAQAWRPYLQLPQLAMQNRELNSEEAAQASQALWDSAERASEMISLMWTSSWAPYGHHPLLADSSVPSVEQVSETIQSVYDELALRVATERPEDTLVQVAGALDQLGLRLQIAAQQLRHIAAERLAAKEASHVARRGN